ncbi:MAG: hypothetical protein ACRDNZ_22805 [Streptosporangiaceae bacterium]
MGGINWGDVPTWFAVGVGALVDGGNSTNSCTLSLRRMMTGNPVSRLDDTELLAAIGRMVVEAALRARNFVAHSIVQQDAISEGRAALFVLHPRTGETMITTGQAVNNARLIREGRDRIQAEITAETSRHEPSRG